jgi:hypothetical protein
MVHLENAYWNVMARPIMEEYWKQTQFINRVNVPFVQGVNPSSALPAELLKVPDAPATQVMKTAPAKFPGSSLSEIELPLATISADPI